jgi:hypothetical protein
VQLLVSEWCTPCRAAEAIWQQVADRRDIAFEVLDMAQPEARAVAQRHSLKSVPAVIVDDKLMAVGVQTLDKALDLIADAPERTASPMRFVGITLAPSSRWALIASSIYLALGGLPLALEGTLYGGALSPSFLHLMGVGFVVFAIFGFAEHMLPRFASRPIWSGSVATLQQVLAHLGVVGLAIGLGGGGRAVLVAGGICCVGALSLFATRVLPVLTSVGSESQLQSAPETEML